MAPRNKLLVLFDKYRDYLKSIAVKGNYKGNRIKGNETKNKILNFYIKNGRWPSRTSDKVIERRLGTRFENYISKQAVGFDKNLRRIVMATGRKSNNKRKHNVQEFKQEIRDFLKEHGRVPSTSYEYQTVEGEARLRHKLDYYTQECNDKAFLGEVYAVDKCHKSGIPVKYRAIINEALNQEIEKPLIRLV